jgi:hypothetical protein
MVTLRQDEARGPSNEGSRGFPTEGSEVRRANAISEDKSALTTPAIEFRNVDFSYDDKKVLDSLSFQGKKRWR